MNINKIKFSLFLIICLLSSGLHAQKNYQVTGTIIGINNKGVADISVSVRGESTQPTYTDSLGNFAISVPQKNATLLIVPSFDYKPQEYFVSGYIQIYYFLSTTFPITINCPTIKKYGKCQQRIKLRQHVKKATPF